MWKLDKTSPLVDKVEGLLLLAVEVVCVTQLEDDNRSL